MTFRLMRPSERTTGVKLRPTPNFLNLIVVVQAPVAGSQVRRRDREFAAGQEGRALAGDGGEVRLGQRADDAGPLHRLQWSR